MPRTVFLVATILAATLCVAHAKEYKAGSIDVVDPWSRATPHGATVAAGYLKITNNGSTPDRLTGGSSDVAPKFEVHGMTMDNGVAKMRQVKGGLEIKPGDTVELKPGSYHLMFMGLTKPLTPGEHIKATMQFEKAGAVDVEFDVRAMGAQSEDTMPAMQMQH